MALVQRKLGTANSCEQFGSGIYYWNFFTLKFGANYFK